MAYDGKLKFDTGIDTSGFQMGLNGLSSMASKGLNLLSSSFSATFEGIKKAGSGIWDFMSDSVQVGQTFEASMSQVMATMGITKDSVQNGVNSYELLKETAEEMGATTQFSASQASDALNYLALAGYDAEKACGALPTVLNIAAAGGMELAQASDMVTDAMSALGIEATSDNLEEFGDKLAKTSQKSNTSVAQLGEAILTVGGTAKNLAGGTTEMNTALGILADNGIKGAEGGTALRNMILALGSPTDNAKKQLDALGVQVYDTEGKMRPLNEIFGDLNSSMADMTDEQQNIALSDIFNKVDLKSSSALLANCGDRWNELTGYINDSNGACEDMAKTMNDNLKGDITSMQSALEGLQIALADTLNKDLRTIVQNATGYLATLRKSFLDGGWEGLGKGIANVLTRGIRDSKNIVSKYMILGTRMITAITDGISENSDFITKSLGNMISQAVTSGGGIYSNVYAVGLELITGIAESIANNSDKLVTSLMGNIMLIIDSITTNAPLLLQAGLTIIQAILNGILQNTEQIVICAYTLLNSLIECLNANIFLILDVALQIIMALTNALIENLPMLLESALQLVMNLAQYIADNLPLLIDCAIEILNTLISFIFDNLPRLLECALNIIIQLVEYLLSENCLNKLLESATQIIMSLITFIIESLPLLIDCAVQIITSIIYYIVDNLDLLLDCALQIIYALIAGLLDAKIELATTSVKLISSIIEKFKEYDWHSLGRDIIDGIKNGFLSGYEAVKNAFFDTFDDLKNTFCQFWDINSPSKVMENLTEYLPKGMSIGFKNEIPNTIDDFNSSMNDLSDGLDTDVVYSKLKKSQISGINFDEIYSQMQELNYSQSTPSYSGVLQQAYKSNHGGTQQGENSDTQRTIVVENYLFKNSQKLNSFVINAGVLENARSGGVAI